MNNFESELAKEGAKATAEICKDVAEDVVRPTSKSIGKNLGLMFDGFMGWLGCWGEKQIIKQRKNIEDFKKSLNENISNIPNENLKEPDMNIVGPAIESAKFFYEEEYYKEMFSNLIAAACDNSKINRIHPSYTQIIKQLSPIDAKLLSMFKYNNTYPIVKIQIEHVDRTITPFQQYLFDLKDKHNEFEGDEYIRLTSSLENLIRLGLVIKNDKILELGYDYEKFRENPLYEGFSNFKSNDADKIELIKYRLELSNFGDDFVGICF